MKKIIYCHPWTILFGFWANIKPPVFLVILILCSSWPVYGLDFVVNNNGNEADMVINAQCVTAGGNCTLRAALEEANYWAGPHHITFAEPMDITYPQIPPITQSGVTIDGSNHWNFSLDRPGVFITGASTQDFLGYYVLEIQSNSNTIMGVGFSGISHGILLNGRDNIIGGPNPGEDNVIFVSYNGNRETGVGIRVQQPHNTIFYNRIGFVSRINTYADYTGQVGITVWEADGTNNITNNIIGNQSSCGIYSYSSSEFTLSNNYIGYFGAGSEYTAIANKEGIFITDSHHFTIENNFLKENEGGIIMNSVNDNILITNNDISAKDGDYPINYGISIESFNAGVTIYNNRVSGFNSHGIYVYLSDAIAINSNAIEGNSEDGIHLNRVTHSTIDNNWIANNGQNGIHLYDTDYSYIASNDIGFTLTSPYNAGNTGHGILLEQGSSYNVVGTPTSGNVIGWNKISGIALTGEETINNNIQGNLIGSTNPEWFTSGNLHEAPNSYYGISLSQGTNNNWIGSQDGPNKILTSQGAGILINSSNDNQVTANLIGTDGGTNHWGNADGGIAIMNGSGNRIAYNEVAYNRGDWGGIFIYGTSATGNSLTSNSIHHNSGSGVFLSGGANQAISPPELTISSSTLSGTTCPNCSVDIYTDSQDEGRYFEYHLVADAAGMFSWDGKYTEPFITAITTDLSNNSSAFSAPVAAPNKSGILFFLPAILSASQQ